MKYLIVCLLLSGCSTIRGVEITKSEREACIAETCTVWTESELIKLGQRFFREGYTAGKKAEKASI